MSSRAAQEWQVRAYQPADAPHVSALYEEVYRRPLDEHFYRWKLHTLHAESGVANVWVAADDGGLVGHYGGAPRRFQLQGREIEARHTSDAMTSPRFRRQGIYGAIGTAAHDSWRESGEAFLYGLPNDKWGSRVAYLNYRRMFPAVWLRRPLLPHQLIARRYRLPGALLWPMQGANRLAQAAWNRPLERDAHSIEVEAVTYPGEEYDVLWARLQGAYEALVVRDRTWLIYRYVNVPGCDYHLLLARRAMEPVGFLAYRVTAGPGGLSGWIVDLFTAPDDRATRAALLLTAVRKLLELGTAAVRILLPPDTPLFTQLRGAGFSPATGAFGCHIVPLAWEDPPALFADPCRWFTMAGDYDII